MDSKYTSDAGSIEAVYNLLKNSTGPDGNRDSSYLTMISYEGLMFGIINIVGKFVNSSSLNTNIYIQWCISKQLLKQMRFESFLIFVIYKTHNVVFVFPNYNYS
jgi:hypothetical protein